MSDPSGRTKPIAINPIQWSAGADGSLDRSLMPPSRDLFALVRRAGFDSIVAGVPADMADDEYAAELRKARLTPAPSYINIPAPEDAVPLARTLDLVRTIAAQQAAFGVDAVFLACGRSLSDGRRRQTPAIGVAHEAGRLATLIDHIGRAAELVKAAGLASALHPHVGTWIETEAETRAVLDGIGEALLGFGPDSGHLSWARADIAGLLADYGHRVTAVHIKDVRIGVRDASLRLGRSYNETVLAGIWAEPGTGDLALTQLLAPIRDRNAWFIMEVDRPTTTPAESAEMSATWGREWRHAGASA